VARQIIVIDAALDTTGKTLTLTYACWVAALANRIKVLPNFVSAVPPSGNVTWGITAAELTALQAGTVVEQTATSSFDISAGNPTTAAMESALQSKYTAILNSVQGTASAVAHLIGAQFDGTTWTAGP
jgi:hypothetical protein